MGDARFRKTLAIIKSPAVSVLLGKAFIAKFVNWILPPEHKIMLQNFASVPIIITVIKKENKRKQEAQEAD